MFRLLSYFADLKRLFGEFNTKRNFRVPKAEAERLAPIFASAILELIRNGKSYSAIYKRLCAQRRIVFTNKHIAYLASLVNKSY